MHTTAGELSDFVFALSLFQVGKCRRRRLSANASASA